MNEADFIQRLKEHKQEAFGQLVKQYQKMVLNICLGYVHNRDDAWDLAQDVFLEVHSKIDGFRSESKLSTWIYKIAVHKSLNYIRDNKKTKTTLRFDQKGDNEVSVLNIRTSENLQSDFKIENDERKKRLDSAIDSLPENQRTAFVLNKFDDNSYKEVADIMGLSLSSVESLLFRAKQNLQKKLLECYKNLNS
ncbi:MAG: sigma-70 family RNA polymerase sigma factor [Bacteroidales bacterium]|nr:sigma-70 family RNA polymerase sigma factor [Bacteroidales bacterium]MCF8457620.1 sigma-70 family RNA polymerase sigma factor [Bacteroidales bacterium]